MNQRPYNFDRSFDAPTSSGGAKERTMAQVPVNTPHDGPASSVVKTAASSPVSAPTKTFEQGFEEGFQAGLTHRSQEREEHVRQALEAIKAGVQDVKQTSREVAVTSLRTASRLVAEGLQTLFPTLMNKRELLEKELVHKLDPFLRDLQAKDVQIFVHPDLVSFLDMHLRSLPDTHFMVRADNHLVPGDCRIAWESSSVDIIKKRFLDEVLRLVEGLADAPTDS